MSIIDLIMGGFIAALLIIYVGKNKENETKNEGLQKEIEESIRTTESKNSFNNLDNVEQSNWLFDLLKKRRNKAGK